MYQLTEKLRINLAASTRTQRAVFVGLSVVLLLVLLKNYPQIIGIAVLLGTLAVFTKALLFRIWDLARKIRMPLLRRVVRIVRAMRLFFAISPEIEFLHAVTVFLVLVSFAYILASKDPSGFNTLGQVLLGLVCVATALDTGRQIVQLTRVTWARSIGKILLAGIGAALFYIAIAIAKHVVHGITATDPKYYSEFTSLFAMVLMPLLYLVLGSALLALWAIVQLVIAFAILALGSIMGGITSNAPTWKHFLYRLQQGKRPPRDYRPPAGDLRWAVVWMRPFGLLLSVGLILSAISYLLQTYEKPLEAAMVKTLVAIEYKGGGKCLGLPAGAEVAYLEKGTVSIVEQIQQRFSFSTQRCDFPG